MSKFLTLNGSDCKNCYKCLRECPVKSISFTGNEAQIIDDECILCGRCAAICPDGAEQATEYANALSELLHDGKKVIASVDPSFVAAFENVDMTSMENALQQLGFFKAEETSVGAAIVRREYERIADEGDRDVIITSSCPSVNLLMQKHFPQALPYLADVISPVQAHCLDIRRRYPDASVVCVGPCPARKDEAERYAGYADFVLTFDELAMLFADRGIEPVRADMTNEGGKAGLFAVSGGIIEAMRCGGGYTYVSVDGTDECIEALKDVVSGRLTRCFIEMSSCRGGCIGGPSACKNGAGVLRARADVLRRAGENDFEGETIEPSRLRKSFQPLEFHRKQIDSSDIEVILKKMGRTRPEHELNCGCCGYGTCRELADAVHRGRADISMCLPYMREKAESFSANMIRNTPDGILVLNERLEIQQINKSCCKLLSIRDDADVIGVPVMRILDQKDFIDVRDGVRKIRGERVYLAKYKEYVEQTIVYDDDFKLLICIMRDVTSDEEERSRKEKLSIQTVETADRVVEKQMRIVQEIASLLGETAAETKIALTKLKESIRDE